MVKAASLRRFLCLTALSISFIGCSEEPPAYNNKMTIGVVSYGDSEVSLEKYQRFQNYLAEQTKIPLELEIAYNELQAVEQIERNRWQIVFAPPGIAAMADKQGYTQEFVLERADQSEYSLIVVDDSSSIQDLDDLAFSEVAMGEPGSAAGYYLPLYNLYGLTLDKVHFAPTPEKVLEWIDDGTVDAGAISEQELQEFQSNFPDTEFRVLAQSKRKIPPGVVMLGLIERGQSEFITRVMREAPADIVSDAQYIANANLPDYNEMIRVVERIRPLESQVKQEPAVLTLEHLGKETESSNDESESSEAENTAEGQVD